MTTIKSRWSFLSKHCLGTLCGAAIICSNSSLGATTYSHDSVNRLTNAAYSDVSRESYSYDNAGNRLQRITRGPTVHSDAVSPSVPTSLTTEEVSPNELRLTWNRVFDTGGSGMAGYYVYTNGVLYASTTARNLILSGLQDNTQYSITIAAHDRAGNISPSSAPIEFFRLGPPSLRNPGLTSGVLGFNLHGAIGSNYVIESSSNLVDWESILTNIIPESSFRHIADPEATNRPRRFYRALQSTNEPPEPRELIINGSFESPIPEMTSSGFVGLPVGDARLTGWTISGTGGPVYCSTSGARAGEGTNDISFNGGDTQAGTQISQAFATVPGYAYSLTFLVSRASGSFNQVVTLRASVNSRNGDVLGSDESSPPEQFHWLSRHIIFTAVSASTTATFLDVSRSTSGIDLLLDNVSVQRLVRE